MADPVKEKQRAGDRISIMDLSDLSGIFKMKKSSARPAESASQSK